MIDLKSPNTPVKTINKHVSEFKWKRMKTNTLNAMGNNKIEWINKWEAQYG